MLQVTEFLLSSLEQPRGGSSLAGGSGFVCRQECGEGGLGSWDSTWGVLTPHFYSSAWALCMDHEAASSLEEIQASNPGCFN